MGFNNFFISFYKSFLKCFRHKKFQLLYFWLFKSLVNFLLMLIYLYFLGAFFENSFFFILIDVGIFEVFSIYFFRSGGGFVLHGMWCEARLRVRVRLAICNRFWCEGSFHPSEDQLIESILARS